MKKIPLTKGEYAIVDDKDYEELSQYKWCSSGHGYAARSSVKGEFEAYRPVRMHRQIMRAKTGEQVDHRNGNRLDNRRENLRLCTAKENARNKRTGRDCRGVTLQWGKWIAQIQVDGEYHYLGRYVDKEEAMREYDKAARKFFGEFAVTNFKETK